MLVQKSAVEELGRMYWYSVTLSLERLCCYIIYYMRTGEAVLIKQEYYRTTGETAGRVEHWGGCVGTADFYRMTREDVLIQTGTTGALGRPCWDGRML